MSDIVTIRDVDIVTAEIKTIEMQVAKYAIYGYIEIGKRLVEAKEMVGHGGWGKYLEEKVRYSQQWATNLMNLYKEYGSAQESLFESFANSQSFGNIDVTKHILLLAVPAEERAEFAENNNVENKTVQELKEALRDRDANLQEVKLQTARAESAEAEVEKLNAAVLDQVEMLEAKDAELSQLEDKLVDLRVKAEAAEKKQAEATGKVDKLQKQLAKAQEGEKTAKEALQKAKEHPEIPEAMMEEMRQQVAADAAAKATEDLQRQLNDAKAVAAEAEKRRSAAETALAEAEKKARATDGNIALVKAYMEGVQDQFNKLVGAIKLVEQADPERGANLRKNAREKVLPVLIKVLEG